jgi:hypothetical protein
MLSQEVSWETTFFVALLRGDSARRTSGFSTTTERAKRDAWMRQKLTTQTMGLALHRSMAPCPNFTMLATVWHGLLPVPPQQKKEALGNSYSVRIRCLGQSLGPCCKRSQKKQILEN